MYICDKRHTSGRQDTDALNLAPLLKMSCDNLLNVIRDMYPADVQCAVHAHETAHTTHIIAVGGELVAPKAVDVGRKDVAQPAVLFDACIRQPVQVLAVLPAGTQPAREEQAEV